MAGDLLVRGGTLVDGTATAQATRADVRVRDRVIVEVGANLDADGETGDRRRRRDRRARLHRLPHALRPVGVVGPAASTRCPNTASRPSSPGTARSRSRRCVPPDRVARVRRLRLHRRHPRRRVRHRYPVDVGVVRRVERRAPDARHRGQHRRARRPLQPARLRDGRRRLGPRRHARRAGAPRGGARRVAGRGCAWLVDVVRRHRPARARGAEPRCRRRRVRHVDRRARPRAGWRAGARVPALDQGHRSPARRHRAGRALVRRPRRGVHLEPARAEQPRPVARRAFDRAGPPAACGRMPRVRAGVAATVQPERQLRPVARVHRRARVEPAHPTVARREAPPTRRRRRGVRRPAPIGTRSATVSRSSR